jgi:DNA-binding transcriptional ArsR family regulator
MAMQSASILDRTFAAIADPTRRAIIERLATEDRLTVSDLAAPFAMSLPAVLKHVGVLAEAGLVTRDKIGRTVYCRLQSGPLRDVSRWLARFDSLQPDETATAAARPVRAAKKPGQSAGRKRAVKTSPAKRPTAKPSAAKPPRKRPTKKPAKPSPRTKPQGSRTSASPRRRSASGTRRGMGRRR